MNKGSVQAEGIKGSDHYVFCESRSGGMWQTLPPEYLRLLAKAGFYTHCTLGTDLGISGKRSTYLDGRLHLAYVVSFYVTQLSC